MDVRIFVILSCCLVFTRGLRGGRNQHHNNNKPDLTRSFQTKDFDHYDEETNRDDYDIEEDEVTFPPESPPKHHPKKHHQHHNNQHNEGRIVFPGDFQSSTVSNPDVVINNRKIPTKDDIHKEDLKVRLSRVGSIDEFLDMFVDPTSIPMTEDVIDGATNSTDNTTLMPEIHIAGIAGIVGSIQPATHRSTMGRALGTDGLPANVMTLPQATCRPELQLVELEKPTDPEMVFFPTCVRLQRCSGCCESELVQCEAKQVTNITVKVIVVKYSSSSTRMKHVGYKYTTLQVHETCDIYCKIKESDCNVNQIYKKDKCRCECTNTDVMDACTGDNKLWDPRECRCVCRQQMECSTGNFFDAETCKCLPLNVRVAMTAQGITPNNKKIPGGIRGLGRNEGRLDHAQQHGHQYMTLPPSIPEIGFQEQNYEDGDYMYPEGDDIIVPNKKQQRGRGGKDAKPAKKKKNNNNENNRRQRVWF